MGPEVVSCILAHSHLSGSTLPSRQDVELTCQLATLLKEAGVQLRDHLIFCDGKASSMAELGLLTP